MTSLEYVLAANVVVWVAVAGYAAFVAKSAGRVEERVTRLTLMCDQLDGEGGGHDA